MYLRWYLQGRSFTKKFRIDGKVVIVTGCNTGIGKETVLELAARGARVYMACRDIKKCDEARLEIVSKTGNNEIFTRKLDLGSQESIREFVQKYAYTHTRVRIFKQNFHNFSLSVFNKVLKTKIHVWIFSSTTLA